MNFFPAFRGLCQGNPISLLLRHVMEVLSKMLSTASQARLIAGFSVAWSDLLWLEIFQSFCVAQSFFVMTM